MWNLPDLLRPASVDSFLEHVRDRQPMQIGAEDPNRFAGLFSWSELETIFARGLFNAEDLKLTANGKALELQSTNWAGPDGALKPLAMQALSRMGVSAIVNNIQRATTPLWNLACDIERRLADTVTIGAIASFSSSAALTVHFDPEDLLVIQIAGTKNWNLLGAPVEGSGLSRKVTPPPADVARRITMHPGDVLFVPSGQHHCCDQEGASLHLGVLISRQTGADFFRYIRDEVRADLFFSNPIPHGHGGAALDAYETEFKSRLVEIVERASLEAFLTEQNSRHAAVSGLDLLGRRDIGAPGAVLCLVTRRPIPLPASGPITAAGVSIDASPSLVAAIALLNERGHLEVAELMQTLIDRHGEPELREAMLRLVESGLARIEFPVGESRVAPGVPQRD